MRQPCLTTLARNALNHAATPAQAYALLARRTHQPLPSARAVCLALSIPLTETTRRLNDCYHALLAHPRPSSENDTGELLEALGVFDIPATLTPTQHAVIDLFLIAIDAMGGIRPGHHHGLTRWFTTGNLTTAYLSLTAARPLPRTGDPTTYWTTLVQAGELLLATPNPDTRITYALTQCRTQAAAHTTNP
ncbi:hypothetical protein GCM10018790_32260 [Kitasatospora xanthocidica]|uniref:hypothetical protein n=1 Tax=Kitasatospora xanthocidica TaxID=83382 RepID=UPI0016766EF9|nr:hypothetical protein [Kitasatospora xanthocidica]GHF51886.1 hypothetical protein GCM10018790_32260 [Kitasatospora xanthocidica]